MTGQEIVVRKSSELKTGERRAEGDWSGANKENFRGSQENKAEQQRPSSAFATNAENNSAAEASRVEQTGQIESNEIAGGVPVALPSDLVNLLKTSIDLLNQKFDSFSNSVSTKIERIEQNYEQLNSRIEVLGRSSAAVKDADKLRVTCEFGEQTREFEM